MRRLILLVFVGMLVPGCATHSAFQPETINLNENALVIKGWTDGGEFCVEITLEAKSKNASLYSVSILTPDGRRLDPADWSDKTPKSPKVNVGFGVGLGGLGRRSDHDGHGGHDEENSGFGLVPGVGLGMPLGGDESGRIIAVKACWGLATIAALITDCSLEVAVVRPILKRTEITTTELTMAAAPDTQAPPGEIEDADDRESVKDLVREIDFTAKGPSKTRIVEPRD